MDMVHVCWIQENMTYKAKDSPPGYSPDAVGKGPNLDLSDRTCTQWDQESQFHEAILSL